MPQLTGGFAPHITVVHGRLFGEVVEAGFDSPNLGHVSTAQDRALVHAPDGWCEVAGIGRQHQEAHRCQHNMSLGWLLLWGIPNLSSADRCFLFLNT